jgi:hypothetical protein
MSQANLQRVKILTQQIKLETSQPMADWELVQQLLDELMENHRQYKSYALSNNLIPYHPSTSRIAS